jgi:long-subunit fatty acid transport protein
MERIRIKMASAILSGCVLAGGWLSAARGSNGVEDFGVSAPAQARGGADVAIGDTALSQVDNPASMSFLPDCRTYDFMSKIILPRVEWAGPTGTSQSTIAVIPAVNAAAAFQIDDDLSWGFALHTKGGQADSFRHHSLFVPSAIVLRDRADFEDVDIPLNFSYRVTDKLCIGLGARVEVASLRFTVDFGPVDANFERGYAVGGGFQGGAIYKATDCLTLGIAYRSPTWFGSLDGGDADVRVFIPRDGSIAASLGSASIHNFLLPQRISAGAAYDLTPDIKLVTEARWINYEHSSLRQFNVNTNGLAFPPVPRVVPFPIAYRDEGVFIVGAEFKLTECLKWAVGYNYNTDPLKENSLLPIADVTNKHNITTGVTLSRCNWWITAGYAIGLTSTLQANGTTTFPSPNDYPTSKMSETQHNLFMGFGFTR